MYLKQNQHCPDQRVYLYQFLDVRVQHTNAYLGYLQRFHSSLRLATQAGTG